MSKKAEIPSYDLSQRRPKVLLVGNGIVKQNGISTEEIIRKACKDGFNFDYFEEYSKDDLIPYPILSMISSDTNDSVRQNKYLQVFENADCSKELVEKLSKLNFDAILTTNYTYEFEDCFVGNYSLYLLFCF